MSGLGGGCCRDLTPKGKTMVRDAYKFVIPTLLLSIFFALLKLPYLAAPFIILTIFIAYFFRNPIRQIPDGKNLIVSPADGKVVKIFKPSDGGDQTISIFLNIFNVHVNRSPISGELKGLQYKRGKFKAAFEDEASRVNEQNVITISGNGIQVVVRQIAGLIARRVICWKKPGDSLERGELFGLIRFGSRVDIVMPENVKIRVKVGDRVEGGTTILGEHP
jgi:phosphatidylserine decarboxylase